MSAMRFDFGDCVRGPVLVNDGQGTRIARPRRVLEGEVIGLLSFQPDVALVRTEDREEAYVRVERVLPDAPEWTL